MNFTKELNYKVEYVLSHPIIYIYKINYYNKIIYSYFS